MSKFTVSSILAGYLIDLFVFPVMNDNSTLIPVLIGIRVLYYLVLYSYPCSCWYGFGMLRQFKG